MQPYFFPYLGYFQLVRSVNTFVFYDDVAFINRGWINRNRILINGNPSYITIPVSKASQNKSINQVSISYHGDWKKRMLKSVEFAYKRAPYFDSTFKLLKDVIESEGTRISDLAILSVERVAHELALSVEFKRASEDHPSTRGMDKSDRLIQICKENSGDTYVNLLGGEELYEREYFRRHSVELQFIVNSFPIYPQHGNSFVNGLSILDALMFNSLESVRDMCERFTLK